MATLTATNSAVESVVVAQLNRRGWQYMGELCPAVMNALGLENNGNWEIPRAVSDALMRLVERGVIVRLMGSIDAFILP